jgi:hypothetical protein
MNRLLALPLFALLLLAACGDAPDGVTQTTPPAEEAMEDMNHDAMDGATTADAANVRMVEGVQVADIEAGRMGYAPGALELTAGVPARLVFTRTVESACSSQIQIPAFGVPVTDLPMNEPVAVEFTPTESGEFEFVCGMDMQRGSLVVRS